MKFLDIPGNTTARGTVGVARLQKHFQPRAVTGSAGEWHDGRARVARFG